MALVLVVIDRCWLVYGLLENPKDKFAFIYDTPIAMDHSHFRAHCKRGFKYIMDSRHFETFNWVRFILLAVVLTFVQQDAQ